MKTARQSGPSAPSLAAPSLKLRPARRLLCQSARGWRSRAHQARPSAASAVTIRRSFAEDFVLGVGASPSTEGPGDQGRLPTARSKTPATVARRALSSPATLRAA